MFPIIMEKFCFRFLSHLFLLHLLLACFYVAATNITTDQSTLLSLKDHITTDPFQFLANNWSAASSLVCEWMGVICSSLYHRVTALNISNMNLTGTIPPHLGNLSFLVSLDLSGNNFHGNLPSELSQLHQLEVLNLTENNFSGEIPSSLGSLNRLRIFSLKRNSFTGFIPPSIFNISKLEELRLSFNSLQGSIPIEIGNLHSLKILAIGQNQLSGSMPRKIFNISSLELVAFYNNRLYGSLPDYMCHHLQRLNYLDLSFNQLSGGMPSSISQCSKLQSLDLSSNNFGGIIPKEIGNLEMLRVLYLDYNNFKGAIPQELGGLSKLQILAFINNSLTGFIPKEIGNLTMLQTLAFYGNHLTGVIPLELCNLQNLEEIYLGDNNIFGPIPVGIFNLSMIKLIGIERNNLSGNLPSNMGYGLPNLEEIYLNENGLSGLIPHSISNCSKLTVIQISGNKFSGFIPDSLGNLRFLKWLNLYSNNLTSNSLSPELSIIYSLVNCRHLTGFDLGNNPLNGILPSSFGNLSTSIEKIYLINCKIKGKIPNSIGNLSSLYLLNMHGNHLIGSVPSSIQYLRELQMLDLGDNKLVSRVSLVNLCKLGSLFEIYLSHNQISGSIPQCLGEVTSLRHLHLASNRLNSNIPTQLWNLKDLLELNLSSNSLSGSLPNEVGHLKAATILDLSMNQISGGIPISVGALQSLQHFYLHGNRLEGSIPETIGMMLSLESLDLSHNNLFGSIPRSLERLHYLEYFDVSFNHLSGEIPCEGPFENFTSASFDTNEALCGKSRFHVPPCCTRSGTRKHFQIIFILLVVGAITGGILLGFVCLKYRKKEKVYNTTDVLSVRTQDRISYYELLQATDRYSESNLLGTGSFGSVYKGTFNDGRILAIKVFNIQQEDAFKSFEVECQVLHGLHHRNLIKVISCCSNLDFKALVLEFMPNGDLGTWLHSPNYFLDIMERWNIMIDVACALDYLHFGYSTPVVHCDLKPSNVLLDEDMVARISDFGIAKLLGEEESIMYTQTLATLGYMAPEYGLEGSISRKCDIYSYGIMLMEVFTGVKPSNDMFGGNLNLRDWVKNSFPHSLVEVIDANMLRPGEENFKEKLDCLSSIMEVALNCTMESPKERSNISDVLAALEKIKLRLSVYV